MQVNCPDCNTPSGLRAPTWTGWGSAKNKKKEDGAKNVVVAKHESVN